VLAIGAVVDLAVLVARDHDQLHHAISLLLAGATREARRRSLEAARVGLATHADGEATVLHEALSHIAAPHDFAGVVAQVLAAHRTQESILRRMDPDGERGEWACSVVRLHRSLYVHAEHEHAVVMAALRRCLPQGQYHCLASMYATEKMRAVGMLGSLMPSRGARDVKL
jgi:hypothetical protein